MIQINQESFFQEKDLIQLSRFHISTMNTLLPNLAIFLQEFCFGKFIFNGFIKFVKRIIFLCFNFFSFLPNDLFNNNIAILEKKMIYFCLKSNFCG